VINFNTMKKVTKLIKRVGKAYLKGWVKMYEPAIKYGAPIIF